MENRVILSTFLTFLETFKQQQQRAKRQQGTARKEQQPTATTTSEKYFDWGFDAQFENFT